MEKVVGTIAAGAAVYFIIQKLRSPDNKHLPPRVRKGIPLLGFLAEYRKNPVKAFLWAREKYGDVFMFNMLLFDAVVVCNPDLYKPIYNDPEKEGSHFSFAGVAEISKAISRGENGYLKYKDFQPATEAIRLALSHSLLSEYSQMIQYRIKQLIEKQIATNPVVDFGEFGNELVSMAELECVIGYTLWERHPEDAQKLVKALIELENAAVQADVLFLSNWKTPGFKKCLALRDIIDPLLDKARDLPTEKPSYMKEWLKFYAECREKWNCTPVTDEYITDHLRNHITLVAVAARTNTVHQFIWTVLKTMVRPKYWNMLMEEQKELKSRVGGDETSFPWEQVEKLPVLEACLRETMRMDGPIFGTRNIVSDVQIGDYIVPGGKFVMMCPGVNHYDPKVFPEPFEYNPERFMSKQDHGMKYLPFGAGKHICVGRFFAMMVMKSAFTTLIQHFNIELQNPSQVLPEADFSKGLGTSPPSAPVMVRLSKK